MWEFERERQMQQIAMKKLQLSRIQEQQQYIDDLERKKRLEVDTIGGHLNRYGADS